MTTKLLDTYVSEVGKHLPLKKRADIETELRSTLEDMLDDRSQQTGRPPDEDLVVEVLKEMGPPEKVAASYLPERYLIGPRLFPSYKMVLQIVLSIVSVVALVRLGITFSQISLGAEAYLEAFTQWLTEFFASAVQVFGNVTLIFVILEWALPNLKEMPLKWDPRQLSKISPASKVNTLEVVFDTAWTIAFLVIFNFYAHIVGFGFSTEAGFEFYPVLTQAFQGYLPAINLIGILNIALNLVLLRQAAYNLVTRWLSIGVRLLRIGICAAMLQGPALAQLPAKAYASPALADPTRAELLRQVLENGVDAVLVIIIVSEAVTVIKMILAFYRNRRLPVVSVQG